MFKKTSVDVTTDKIDIKYGSMYGSGKRDCDTTKTYCFSDNDCTSQCTNTNESCVHGICRTNINSMEATNDCDPKKGVIGYFIGNTALGKYEYICKSVDPAIAISVNENRMCYGDSSYLIDYLSTFPSINTCTCSNQIIVPATSQKREHVECNAAYIGLVS